MSTRPAAGHPRDVPPMWFALALAAMLALSHWHPGPRLLPPAWNTGVACTCWIGSCVLFWPAVSRFLRNQTGIRPFTPATVLVTDGPYRVTRNPMYLGLVAVLTGLAFALDSLWALVVVPCIALVLHFRFVLREERFLEATFGEAYRDYCRRVRRWL